MGGGKKKSASATDERVENFKRKVSRHLLRRRNKEVTSPRKQGGGAGRRKILQGALRKENGQPGLVIIKKIWERRRKPKKSRAYLRWNTKIHNVFVRRE